MPIQTLHLRSSTQGKEPTPGASTGQLPVGSIAINFNSLEPFLSIQDSAGNVRRIAGVKIDASAPATPTGGELWIDTTLAAKPVLKVYTGTAWIAPGSQSLGSGAVAPATPSEGDLWVDTSVAGSPVLKVYNGTAWVAVAPDATTTVKGLVQLADAAAITAGTAERVVDAAQLAVKAPLATPAFTGVPTAPTAAAGTSTTQLATTEFVGAALGGTVSIGGTAPATPVDGQIWIDTSVDPPTSNIWDDTNSAWVQAGGTPADASETVKGIAELATQAEVNAGTDDKRIVTPAKLQAYVTEQLKATWLPGDRIGPSDIGTSTWNGPADTLVASGNVEVKIAAGAWGAGGAVAPADQVQVRWIASAVAAAAHAATLTGRVENASGNVGVDYNVTIDKLPASDITINAKSGAAASAVSESDSSTAVHGINAAVRLWLDSSDGTTPEVSIAGGAWTAVPATAAAGLAVATGETFKLRHTTQAGASTVTTTTVRVGWDAASSVAASYASTNVATKAPDVDAVTLVDVVGGDRFTSVAFSVSATMTDDGIPTSTKKLKAYVEGTLKTAVQTSAITVVNQNVMTVPGGTARALQFNGTDSILSHTPANVGNQKIATFAFWVKRTTLGAAQYIYDSSAADTTIYFSVDNKLCGNLRGTGGTNYFWSTNTVLGDASAWYHIVVALDSSQATDANRCKVYVNGAEQSFSSVTYCPKDTVLFTNDTRYIGQEDSVYGLFNGYLADIHFIDGQALDPTSFLNPDGTPKAYAGTYGTNGFHLDGKVPANLGKDAAGSNDFANPGSKVTTVDATTLTFADNTQLANFAAGDAVTEVGNGNDATGTVNGVDTTANTMQFATTAGTWDVGSAVKGPLKTQTITAPLNSDVITNVADNVLTFATAKDLANFAKGDVVKQENSATVTPTNYSSGTFTGGGGMPITDLFDGNLKTAVGSPATPFTEWKHVSNTPITANTSVEYYIAAQTAAGAEWGVGNGGTIQHKYTLNGTLPTGWITLPVSSFPYTFDTFSGKRDASFIGSGVFAVRVDGAILVDGASINPSGTVDSVDTTAKTMKLATSTGNWGPANDGHYVIGPTKTVPAANVKLFCNLDAAGAVSDLQSADPGFTAWTPAGTGPYTGTVTFPATLPTGNAPDADLPAGTTVTVEVEASNAAGSDSAKSNTVTPS